MALVEEKDYIPELEAQVKQYVENIEPIKQSTKIHKRVEMPEFDDDADRKLWELSEIDKCINGDGEMCGKMYFFYNYCWIRDQKGKLRPQFRMADNEWFETVEFAQKSEKYGVICVKRRRAGFSWKAAADVLHDASLNSFFNVGMNSMSEKDSVELFRKVKFIYNLLPQFLRATSTAHNTKMGMHFSYKMKDKLGNSLIKGTQSEIIVVAPTDSAYEGLMLQKWISDEAGKISNLNAMWSYTEPCLMQETKRMGTPIIFGTAGEISREGRDLKKMWDDAKAYNLIRFFFNGYMGMDVDEYGNDRPEEVIRWIVYERYRKKDLDPRELNDFVQQYPLTVSEAFSLANTGGLGNIVHINKQITNLRENPTVKSTGSFVRSDEGKPIFVPSVLGKCIIYEHPKRDLEGYTVAGCDPADHDNVLDEASDMSMYIMSKQYGQQPPKILFEYTDRPQRANDYYEQAAMALEYYNNTKILIENNRYRMIGYFEDFGHKHLLRTQPIGIKQLTPTRQNIIGVRMSADMKEYLEGLVEEYVEDNCDLIPGVPLLEEFIEYGSVNTDRVMAFGVTLIAIKDDKLLAKHRDSVKRNLPSARIVNVNGVLTRAIPKSFDQKGRFNQFNRQ